MKNKIITTFWKGGKDTDSPYISCIRLTLNLTSKKWVILAHFRVKNSKKHQK